MFPTLYSRLLLGLAWQTPSDHYYKQKPASCQLSSSVLYLIFKACSGQQGWGTTQVGTWKNLKDNFLLRTEAPVRSEFLSLLRISEFFGFQWQKLAEILSLFKLYNNLGKVAVRVKLWLIIYCGHLVEWIVK